MTALALALTGFPLSPTSAAPSSSGLLDLSSLTVPETLGYVIETWQPRDTPPKGLVIHLQDAHANPEAQAHLSQLLGLLHELWGVTQVALEGAAGPLDTTLFSDFPDPDSTQPLATLFRDEGLFTGAEEYAITHPNALTLWGVEDEALYREHLRAAQQSRAALTQIEATLKAWSDTLVPLKRRLYPPPLQHLQDLWAAYDRGGHPANGGVADGSAATRRVPADRNDGVTLQTYLTELARSATTLKLDVAAYPMITLALRADASARASLRPAALLEEMETLARAIEEAALTTEAQRTLARLLRHVALLEGLVHARLSPTESQAYRRLRASLTADALWQSLSSMTRHPLPVTKRGLEQLIASLPAHERFYALAHQRDAALVRHTLKLIEHSDQAEGSRLKAEGGGNSLEPRASSLEPKVAVLIAGGFHTPGITAALQARGIAYVVITPRVEHAQDASRSDAGLSNTLPPLADVLAHVQRASLQMPLATDPQSPPTTGAVPTVKDPTTGQLRTEQLTFRTKRDAVTYY